jgi:hypothetical protein
VELAGLGRHLELRVVGQQRDNTMEITLLDGVYELN